MFITFSMAVMRMSGAIGFNPLFGKSNFPVKIRAYFIFALSLLLYLSADQTQMAYPGSMAEYILMLAGELFLGAVLAFAMELAFLTIRFASSIMDYSMGLSMAQVYDPQYGTQSTVSSGIYYAFMVLIFFASNSHLRLLELFYQSVQLIPFGKVTFNPMLVHVITAGFCQGILTGMQFAFPMIAIELVSECFYGKFPGKDHNGAFDDAATVFANGRLYRYHLYIYVSDDVEAFKQYETSLKGVS